MEEPAGHAFISYVREDSDRVDLLQRDLQAAGIAVWRDTADLWPGEDWRMKIRSAITDGALVFIACFSSHSIAREKSYQNEELALAREQLRQRRSDIPWLVPVRFDDCSVPDLDLGGGRTLGLIQYADLFGDRREANIKRLLATIRRLLSHAPSDQDSDAEPPTPLITDRWQLTNDGHQVPILMHVRNNSMSHPGYTSQSHTQSPPPSMRIGIVLPCEPLGSIPATSDIRASFLNFLHGQPCSTLVNAVTTTTTSARWTTREGRGRVNFGAVLDGDAESAPVAWARLLLPHADTRPFSYDPVSAVLIVHIYPRTGDGNVAPPVNLASWHDRFVRALAIPKALTAFLTERLGVATTDGQAAQVGVHLDAPHSMTGLVDTEGLQSIPGSPTSNCFMGWAISSPDGQQAPILAREWLTEMCDNTLYLDNYEPYLEFTRKAQFPGENASSTRTHQPRDSEQRLAERQRGVPARRTSGTGQHPQYDDIPRARGGEAFSLTQAIMVNPNLSPAGAEMLDKAVDWYREKRQRQRTSAEATEAEEARQHVLRELQRRLIPTDHKPDQE